MAGNGHPARSALEYLARHRARHGARFSLVRGTAVAVAVAGAAAGAGALAAALPHGTPGASSHAASTSTSNSNSTSADAVGRVGARLGGRPAARAHLTFGSPATAAAASPAAAPPAAATPAGAASPATADPARAEQALPGCAVAPASLVNATLGVDVGAPKSTATAAGQTKCSYPQGADLLTVQIVFTSESQAVWRSKYQSSLGSGAVVVHDLGDGAFSSSDANHDATQVCTYAHGVELDVVAAVPLAKIEVLAQAIVPRL